MAQDPRLRRLTEYKIMKTERLDQKKILFAGNSLTFYGELIINKNGRPTDGEGIFEKVARSYGDEVRVTNFTFGGAGFVDGRRSHASDGLDESIGEYGIYQLMKAYHPDHYNNAEDNALDSFYDQDVVVLQQRGAGIANSYEQAKLIAALFPPTTRFAVLLTTYDAGNPATTGAALRSSRNDGWTIVPAGQLAYDLYKGRLADRGLEYERSDFVVTKDNVHPNYLMGYLKALGCYCALTGSSALGADRSFVKRSTELYNSPDETRFCEILDSDEQMSIFQKLLDEYIEKENLKG